MKLKLIVLAGAKEGLEIPLKKEKFLIGRAKECALRAGSEAISRRHCAVIRGEAGYTVRDLGSRNGTYVNDARITKEVPLNDGDELRVGPLKFRVTAAEAKDVSSQSADSGAPPNTAKPRKQPPVKDVADVVERTISLSDSATEDDVTRWLLGQVSDAEETLKQTRSMRADETSTTLNRKTESSTVEDISPLAPSSDAENGDVADVVSDEADNEEEEAGKSGPWKWLKRGKPATAKKKPGKLPPRPDQPVKDSGAAAADILREMTRRR